jgi:ferredoxin
VTVLPHPELCPDGLSFEARTGQKLVDALLAHGVAIEHACEKVCACATCHVHIREGLAGLPAADEDEEDQLDDAWGWTPSRACPAASSSTAHRWWWSCRSTRRTTRGSDPLVGR